MAAVVTIINGLIDKILSIKNKESYTKEWI